ncbi:hypothetical protein CANINC_000033 [Pichia inconspicua]|uniref:Uncharacterized protein n=1 Tax=Pichia inconspicua TaxID=52247 RepID=A0A4T0X9V1_9ASCO|nr:hypothetical protein CANINC_000033 [[Candida] inconspicua]
MIRGESDRLQIEHTVSTRAYKVPTIRNLISVDMETTDEQLFDDSNESENTVIHYEETMLSKNGLNLNPVPILQEQNSVEPKKCSDSISKLIGYIGHLTCKYTKNSKKCKEQMFQELRSYSEEYQFEIVSNCMNLSGKKEKKFSVPPHSSEDHEVSLNLLKTPYSLLLHSLRPQLIAFSLLCFIRRYFKQINLKNLVELTILSITFLNMSNNSLIGIKIYAQMMVHRTKRIINELLRLEDYFGKFSGAINRTPYKRVFHRCLNSKFNLVNSSMHFLISMLVNRIERIASFGLNKCTLKEYFIIYGIDDDLEETKVVKNIVKNTSSCACIWYNEPNRILRTLKFTRMVLICILMSSIEIESNYRTTSETENAEVFLINFWNKLGTDINANAPHVMISTKILGTAIELKSINSLIVKISEEIIDDKLLDSFNSENESSLNMDLDVVNESNEDDTVYELSQIIQTISTKLDLIELGKTDFDLTDLKDDVFEFFSYYKETTFGKTNSNEKKDSSNLRRLRMSEILFDDENKKVLKEKRRSSGMNFPIVSVVKNEDSFAIEEDKCNTENEEFQRVLEKLCSKNGHVTNEVNV